MNIPLFIVDTFTSERFKGSPTAICLLENRLSTKHMLSITRELNFPVTAFVTKGSPFRIRYFTPTTEIVACGHATLGAAAVVQHLVEKNELAFVTAMDVSLPFHYVGDSVSFSYPRYAMTEYRKNEALLQSLQITSCQNMFICEELETVFLEVESFGQLKSIAPDFQQLLTGDDQIKEVVITCVGNNSLHDYLLRSFCPWIGIDEDPVTGSVHAALAPYWSARLEKKELRAYQASKRGGELWLFVNDDSVRIEGQCQLVMEGQLHMS